MIRWDPGKSERLRRERGVSFEDVLGFELVGVVGHHVRSNQRLMLFRHAGYIWVVPYVRDSRGIFLKTLFKSRRHLRMVRRGEFHEKI